MTLAIDGSQAAEAREEAAQSLVSAGRTLFTDRGYRQTGFADLAELAGLDPETARTLFPDKAAVFGALIERTVKVAGLLGPDLAHGVDDDLPARLARTYLTLWESNAGEESPLVEIYRIALSDREASGVLRQRITASLNGQVDTLLGTPDAPLRTAVFGAHLGGTAMMRHLVGIEPLASAPLAQVLDMIAPSLRHELLGPAAG
ncbi:TetR family transcriptional regulator [Streptacidiphilus sp. EB129]|uniref:TetR/AcrR family transcriptional regulator n=1 Tax=Streptacidiphilus sp. EB129 TaxID=3156262 RepID=UPI00351345CC